MKKILLLIAFCLIGSNFAFAQDSYNAPISEAELKNILQNTQAPSDEQILEHLREYSLTEEEAVMLYNEAKNRINEAYETGNVDYFMEIQKTPEFQNVQDRVMQDIQRYKEANE